MICRNCGAVLKPDSVFCSSCGTKVDIIENSDSPYDTESQAAQDSFIDGTGKSGTESVQEVPFVNNRSDFGYQPSADFDSNSNNSGAYSAESTGKESGSYRFLFVTLLVILISIIIYSVFNIIVFKLTPDNVMTGYKIAISRIIGEQFAPVIDDNADYTGLGIDDYYTYSDEDSTIYNFTGSEKKKNNSSTTQSSTKEYHSVYNDSDITYSFSAEEIRLLNLFLSNFAEAGVLDIRSGNHDEMLNFVIEQAIINAPNSVCRLGDDSIINNGIRYDRYITSDFVNDRISRYFDLTVQHYSTNIYYYSDGRYYIPEDIANVSSYYSKLDRAVKNDDGTVTVYFSSYDCKGLNVNENIYRGTGTENIGQSKRIGSGEAILKEKYFGEKYANYIVKEYRLIQGRDFDYRNTLVSQ